MAKEYLGTTHRGEPVYYDSEKAADELNNMSDEDFRRMAASTGVFDVLEFVPAGEKQYESIEDPGFIEVISAIDHPGYYHPRDKEGFPIFDVLLDKDGKLAKKQPTSLSIRRRDRSDSP